MYNFGIILGLIPKGGFMKKFILILSLAAISLLNSAPQALADVCYDIDKDTANKVVCIIKQHSEIYEYCSICQTAKPTKINVENVKNTNPILVNDRPLDIAHLYYKKENKFINIGVEAGCIKAGEYGIMPDLDRLMVISPSEESNRQQAKNKAQEIYHQCLAVNSKESNKTTTAEMIKQNSKVNECLAAAVQQEIERGFSKEKQQEMSEYLLKSRKAVFNFYDRIYSQNKYCLGQCGSMANLLPYSDEGYLLQKMLEDLIYLNIAKNGY